MQNYYRQSHSVYPSSCARVPFRISRSAYFLRWVFLAFAALVASGLMDAASHAPRLLSVVLMVVAVGVLLGCVVALFRSILMPRVRDVGLHPAWSLLILLHSIGGLFALALLFIPTDAFAKPARIDYY